MALKKFAGVKNSRIFAALLKGTIEGV
jgi:hypothetical protein